MLRLSTAAVLRRVTQPSLPTLIPNLLASPAPVRCLSTGPSHSPPASPYLASKANPTRAYVSKTAPSSSSSSTAAKVSAADEEDYGYTPNYTPLSDSQPFPSIVITSDELKSHGSFAASQEAFINPDPARVSALHSSMTAANAAIVAHYYMDVELQSVLNALPSKERVFIADSLAMGDAAVRMCEDGAEAVICLGVDFMSESVKSIMSKNGYGHIPVLRSTAKKIGCSLAESAERLSYGAWLTKAKQESANPLHVIYINTSLETKALSSQIIPTVTCTSSNVLKTMLTASLQMEDVSIYYGPDTFMGENLRTMFQKVLANWSDDDIKHKLHPDHDRASIQKLMDNLHVFPNGNCVVHHMFNKSCVDTVLNNYPEAYVSAHLEVPGEMFEIAMEKSLSDEGNVGSTSDILNFIARKVKEKGDALAASGEVPAEKKQLQFILGTEAGMVTSIVTAVQKILSSNPVASKYLAAEIVFPVANDAVMVDETSEFGVVPGVSSGEGCSTAGGCATCPFMKMNDLDSVVDICDTIAAGNIASLSDYAPPNRLEGKMIGDRQAVDVGVDSIMHMRDLMGTGKFGEGLVNQVMGGGRK